jgi:hypothetical protein
MPVTRLQGNTSRVTSLCSGPSGYVYPEAARTIVFSEVDPQGHVQRQLIFVNFSQASYPVVPKLVTLQQGNRTVDFGETFFDYSQSG